MALNPQNLRRLSSEEARRNGRKGGLASVENRRRRKTLKELLLIALEAEHKAGETNAEAIVPRRFSRLLPGMPGRVILFGIRLEKNRLT